MTTLPNSQGMKSEPVDFRGAQTIRQNTAREGGRVYNFPSVTTSKGPH